MRSAPCRWDHTGSNRAKLVDAALDDLDRLLDRLPDAIGDDGRLRHGQADQTAAGNR